MSTTAAARARAAAKSKAKKNSSADAQQQAQKDPKLSVAKAAILVDKNSRTITKLSQLLAIYNKAGASDLDGKGLVAHRIERYKHRITRRLHKLAKFVDTPEHDTPVERVAALVPVRKAALETLQQKRELSMKAKIKAKQMSNTSALMMEKLKVQKAKQLARNALLKAKGAAAQAHTRNKGRGALSKSDPRPNGNSTNTNTCDTTDPDSPSLLLSPSIPPTIHTDLPPLPPPTLRCPAPPQIIYSSTRNICKHAPVPVSVPPSTFLPTVPMPMITQSHS